MRAKGHAPAAVDAHEGIPRGVQVYGIHRTRSVALSAADAQFLFDDDAAALSLGVSPGWARFSAGSRIASEASVGFKARGEAAR
jgi:hypothetical protein